MQPKGYIAAIMRLWWLVALVAVSATAGSYLFTKLQQPVYRSSLLLMSTARLDWGTTMTVQVLLRQQEEQLKTLAIATKVKDRMGLALAPEEIRGKIATKSFADSITIRLDVQDSDPDRARRIALGYGQQFQEEKAAEYALATPENRINVSMLEEPGPGAQISPNLKANTGAGAVMGLLLGLVLALALAYMDDTLRTPEDVSHHLGLATIGQIPSGNPTRPRRWGKTEGGNGW